MDKNTIVGLGLIFLLFLAWQQFLAPSPEELEAQQRTRDSLARVEQLAEAVVPDQDSVAEQVVPTDVAALSDSARIAELSGAFGPFASAASGTADSVVFETDLMKITFSTKGGNISRVLLKNYRKIRENEAGEEFSEPLSLLADDKNRFEYILPIASVPSGGVRTSDLYFTPKVEGNTVRMRATAANGSYFEQVYIINDGTYLIDYDLRLEGLDRTLSQQAEGIQLHWENYLDKIEKNDRYERNYSTIYFKPADESSDYCSCTSSDVEEVDEQPLKWVSMSNQFFNSSLIAESAFRSGRMETVMLDEDADALKKVQADLLLPINRTSSEVFEMGLYVGPNEFRRLSAIGYDLTDIIPFGRSIFGAINRWMIRPFFNFLDSFIGNKGISILMLTLLVKLMLFPLTYKMLVSQSKMQALKPYIEKAKAKHKDDSQAQQMETMKLYGEYGVSPLGGCLPMLAQMPIWFALYRFFPASITFRQENFLWANDLSTFDSFIHLPFEVPLGFGAHISLFAFLWAITTLIYTYYNTRHMDYSAQPAMKYMQYIMPVMFLGFFNSFAAGLTSYLLFSNLINIGQTIITKNFIIDQNKLLAQLEENKKKPKKTSGFRARLEEAMKEQQRRAADTEKTKGRKK
jgi:YidC/Oxa1 family membrane protein insertase